jgi:hypothetical protein
MWFNFSKSEGLDLGFKARLEVAISKLEIAPILLINKVIVQGYCTFQDDNSPIMQILWQTV